MITNLFSIFDPYTTFFRTLNWISAFIIFFVFPNSLWIKKNRFLFIQRQLISYIYAEFKLLIKERNHTLLIIISLFLLVMVNNVLGLAPYIFTATSHIVFSISYSLVIWLGLFIFIWTKNMNKTLIHLIPQETPTVLIPFIVVIEIIRNIIRPITLATRLSANIIAGHLILSLVRRSLINRSLRTLIFIVPAQTALSILEIAVRFIQAYVIRVLLTLYARESY